jgi:ribosomal protein L20
MSVVRESRFYLSGILILLILGLGALSVSAVQVVARGEGLEVTSAEVNALRQRLGKALLKPNRKALVDLAVQNELFAREAVRRGLDCPQAAKAEGFSRKVMLAKCYLDHRLEHLGLMDGAVESYYRANWHDFRNRETGKLQELDADRRRWIEERILAAKKKKFAKEEFKSLCRKYNVIFTDGGSR